MPPSISGLGRLFSTASASLAPSSPRRQRQLESVTEEAHTYDLLFPEAASLQADQRHAFDFRQSDPASMAAAASSSDDKGGFNVQHPRDVRIVVGQYIGGNSRLIYDSQPSILRAGAINGSSLTKAYTDIVERNGSNLGHGGIVQSRTAPHSRQSSFSQITQSLFMSPGSPLSPVNEGANLAGFLRRPSTSEGESAQTMVANEEAKETEAMLMSMFGATGFRAEPGTKVHIKPYTPNDLNASRPPSSGNRRTHLTRSTTTEDLQSLTTHGQGSAVQFTQRRKSPSVLVTKLFSVDQKEDRAENGRTSHHADPSTSPDRSSSKILGGHSRSVSMEGKANQIKTPTYAISLVLYMPAHQQLIRRAISTRSPTVTGHPSLPQDPNAIVQQVNKELFDHCVEYIMARWSMIDRALSSLEVIVRCQICNQLARLDISLPSPAAQTTSTSQGLGVKPAKMRQPPRPTLQLPSNALQDDHLIQKSVESTARRVTSSLQVRVVATGQDRWGIWREEVRSVGKWAGAQEQDFFFLKLMTAFLGIHTEWLKMMESKILKLNRNLSRTRDHQAQHQTIHHRTVLISLDKMSARRLIFLLSAFLPGPLHASSHRSKSPRAVIPEPTSSGSPSYGTPTSRRQSLRRLLQKAQRDADMPDSRRRETAVVDFDAASEVGDDRTVIGVSSTKQNSRRPSDARSVRTSALPIEAERMLFQNSRSPTTATVNSESSIPVAYFSSLGPEPRRTTTSDWRPGSSGSIASISLQRTLSRSESNEQSGTSMDSQSSGRWFWGSRRGSSTETSETPASTSDALGIYGLSKDFRDLRPGNKLSQMIEDASLVAGSPETLRNKENRALTDDSDTKGSLTGTKGLRPSDAASSFPAETDEPFPIDLSVNGDDGVIDIKLPERKEESLSYGSFVSSPRASRTAPSSFRNQLRLASPIPAAATSPPEASKGHSQSHVGGWLRRFNTDLTLQAVQPYDTLKEEIKQAMRAEPRPFTQLFGGNDEKDDGEFHDVSCSIIADVTTFNVTLVTLRRRHPLSPHHQADALFGRSSRDNPDEEFREDVLLETEPELVEAVEKVLSHSSHSSCTASRAPSRPPSPPRSVFHSGCDTPSGFEVPKSECKKVILGALEQLAVDAADEFNNLALGSSSRGSVISGNENVKAETGVVGASQSAVKKGIRSWLEERFTTNTDEV